MYHDGTNCDHVWKRVLICFQLTPKAFAHETEGIRSFPCKQHGLWAIYRSLEGLQQGPSQGRFVECKNGRFSRSISQTQTGIERAIFWLLTNDGRCT